LRLSQDAGVGHHEEPARHPGRRARAEPGDREEPRGLRGQAVLTAAEVLATGQFIARLQAPSGAIAWPDGHVDAWDHIECAMALSACGLSGVARRAYRWLRRAQRGGGAF